MRCKQGLAPAEREVSTGEAMASPSPETERRGGGITQKGRGAIPIDPALGSRKAFRRHERIRNFISAVPGAGRKRAAGCARLWGLVWEERVEVCRTRRELTLDVGLALLVFQKAAVSGWRGRDWPIGVLPCRLARGEWSWAIQASEVPPPLLNGRELLGVAVD